MTAQEDAEKEKTGTAVCGALSFFLSSGHLLLLDLVVDDVA